MPNFYSPLFWGGSHIIFLQCGRFPHFRFNTSANFTLQKNKIHLQIFIDNFQYSRLDSQLTAIHDATATLKTKSKRQLFLDTD